MIIIVHKFKCLTKALVGRKLETLTENILQGHIQGQLVA